jgi:uncharacterized protein YjbJ (UPF0337 family)
MPRGSQRRHDPLSLAVRRTVAGPSISTRKALNTTICDSCERALIHPRYQKEKHEMKPSTDDKATGKLHEVKGTIKEKVGEITNNSDLEAEGQAEKNAGKALNWIGKVENLVGK